MLSRPLVKKHSHSNGVEFGDFCDSISQICVSPNRTKASTNAYYLSSVLGYNKHELVLFAKFANDDQPNLTKGYIPPESIVHSSSANKAARSRTF